MDATKLLTQQHRRLESLMKTTLDAQQPAPRSAGLAQVGDELSKHIASEEQVFYPAVRGRRTEDILLESLEEHLSLKRLLADLLAARPDGADLRRPSSRCSRSRPSTTTRKKRSTCFPKVMKLLDAAALDALGQQMLALQQRLQREGDPRETVAEQTEKAAPLK